MSFKKRFDFNSNQKRMLRFTLVLVALAFSGMVHAEKIDFKRQVEPILEKHCQGCHGPKKQKSGLRLDLRESLLEGGDSGLAAVVPGNPEKSFLVEVIQHLNEDVVMPPDEDKLPEKEINTIVKWIQEGAIWPGQMKASAKKKIDHWSFQPVKRSEVPKVQTQYKNPIDAFLLQRLKKDGLSFSHEASPQDLIRRTFIVLTGLAPKPPEIKAFIHAYHKDKNKAFEGLVDRLLNSKHFGERWAQHWLDVIRWAETNGSEANLYRKNAWVYRDYVVRSFNEDKPYDQFIQEQIAGDSLGMGDATGFLVSGPHVPAATVGREPAAIRQARADRMDEIIQTVGASVMGVTMGCARCHNHKFDPISIKDYYSMTSVFQDVEFGGRFPEYSSNHPRQQKGHQLQMEIENLRRELRGFGGWEENWGAYRELHFKSIKTKSIRIRFKQMYVGLDELEVLEPGLNGKNVALKREGAKVSGFPEKGVDTRNPIDRIHDGEYGTMAWRARMTKGSKDRPWVRIDFSEVKTIDRLRVSNNREYFYDTDYLTQKPYLPRYEFDVDILKDDGSWQPWVGTWFVNKKLNEKRPERIPAIKKIESVISKLAEEGPQPSFVGRFISVQPTRVLLRGSPENPRDPVAPSAPKILNGDLGLSEKDSGAARRLKFAHWISNESNPLTARVMANRVWHHVFGRGIVPTTSDFGKAGAPPSHPELLDWLASEFIQPTQSKGRAWSLKSVIKLLLMSQAYRQSSLPNKNALQVDAGSALLWRFPPRRVEAEVIRDSILQASGSLDTRIGGRGYRIHNVKKTYAQWEVLNNFGEQTWRRMLYQERMRRVDDQLFTAFDFPDCGQVRAKRPVSTTPLQALNLMNSKFVMAQAKLISERALKERGNDPKQAIQRCFELLLGRRADAQELQASLDLIQGESLSLVCRALMNSNEFVFLP